MTNYAGPQFPSIFVENQKDLRTFDRDLITALGQWDRIIKAILDGGISLSDNVDAAVVSFTTNVTPDTEDETTHTLGKIPTYLVVGDINKGGVVYRSGTTFTASKIYTKCTVASCAVKLILF